MREHADRTVGAAPRLCSHGATDGFIEAELAMFFVAVVERLVIVGAFEARGGRATSRPAQVAVEQLRQLGQVQVHHEQFITELMAARLVPAVSNPTVIDTTLHGSLRIDRATPRWRRQAEIPCRRSRRAT